MCRDGNKLNPASSAPATTPGTATTALASPALTAAAAKTTTATATAPAPLALPLPLTLALACKAVSANVAKCCFHGIWLCATRCLAIRSVALHVAAVCPPAIAALTLEGSVAASTSISLTYAGTIGWRAVAWLPVIGTAWAAGATTTSPAPPIAPGTCTVTCTT